MHKAAINNRRRPEKISEGNEDPALDSTPLNCEAEDNSAASHP